MPEISRRDFGKSVAAAGGISALSSAHPGRSDRDPFDQGSERPNIIFIYTDQHSGRLMGCNGHSEVDTPNMDRLASRGTHFRNSYCVSPVCVPGRASMLTGMFASDVGSYCNSTPLDDRVPTWCRRLRDQGYFGLATGKLDLEGGLDFGFKEVETTHGHATNPDITSLFRRPLGYRVDERPLVEGSYEDREHVDHARVQRLLDFLSGDAKGLERPWFFYLGLELPHHPFVGPIRYKDLYLPNLVRLPNLPPGHLESMPLPFQRQRAFKLMATPIPEDRIRRARAAYYAMIKELDDYIGTILDRVEQAGWRDNTIIVHTSDHGEMHGEHGLWLKNNLLEDAARVPMMISGPGIPAGKNVDTPVSQVDLVATLLDVANVPIPKELRGASLLPMIHGRSGNHPGYAYGESHSEGNCTGSFMIRKDHWKYIHFSWFGDALYDLERDPGELNNLAGKPEHAAIQRELHDVLRSLVDPEAVTEQAFQEQDRRLKKIVQESTAEQFYQRILKRLGPGQAGVYTNQYYPGFRS